MKIRTVSALAVLATALTITSANAAVTVIGGGLAENCYLAAERGLRPADSIPVCNMALLDPLTTHDRAATLVNRGILRLAAADARGSFDDFNRGLTMNADMAEGYVNRGAALIMLGRYNEAIEQINKGISLNAKKLQVAYFDRGLANYRLGNLVAAYHDYKQSQLIDPFFDPPTRELQGMTLVIKPAGT